MVHSTASCDARRGTWLVAMGAPNRGRFLGLLVERLDSFRCKLAVRTIQDEVADRDRGPIDRCLEGARRFRSRSLRLRRRCPQVQATATVPQRTRFRPLQLKLASSSCQRHVRFRSLISGWCPRPTRPNCYASISEGMIASIRVSNSSPPRSRFRCIRTCPQYLNGGTKNCDHRAPAPSESLEHSRVML